MGQKPVKVIFVSIDLIVQQNIKFVNYNGSLKLWVKLQSSSAKSNQGVECKI